MVTKMELTTKEMLEKFKEVADELSKLNGQVWQFREVNNHDWSCLAELLLSGSKAHVNLSYHTRTKKLSMYGGFSIIVENRYETLYGERTCIGASPHKSPAQMARDIHRRLLPQYLPEFEKAFQAHCEWEVKRKERLAILKTFAEMIGVQPKLEPHSDRIYGHGKVKEIIACSTIDLKLSVSQEEAFQILQLIA